MLKSVWVLKRHWKSCHWRQWFGPDSRSCKLKYILQNLGPCSQEIKFYACKQNVSLWVSNCVKPPIILNVAFYSPLLTLALFTHCSRTSLICSSVRKSSLKNSIFWISNATNKQHDRHQRPLTTEHACFVKVLNNKKSV